MRLLDRCDAILSPAAPYPAPPLGAGDDANWTYTLSASLWCWPALVVPAGRSVECLPLGVQLIAGPWCEGTCLARLD